MLSSHSEVIEAFGGVRPLAEAIGINPKRAIHWHRRGIPAKYWPAVETIAAEREIKITARDLMRLPVRVVAVDEQARTKPAAAEGASCLVS